MSLSQSHRDYLIREQVIGPALINFVINALIGWSIFHALDEIPIWGDPGVAGDLVVTLFALPLVVCLIATPLVRMAAKKGKVPSLPQGLQSQPWISRLPNHLFVRALFFATVTALIGGPLVLALLKMSGLESMSLTTFIWIKGGVSALAAALISPPIALRAIADSAPAPVAATL